MSRGKVEDPKKPHSLAPIQVDAANDALEIARFREGYGIRVVLLLIVAALTVAGGARLLSSMDTRQTYAVAASQLEHSETDQLNAFLRCALPTYPPEQLSNANSLRFALANAARRAGLGYGRVLAKCTPLLDGFQQTVSAIEAPADTTEHMGAVSKAAHDLRRAWHNYGAYFQHAGQRYDVAQTVPLVDAIADAWQTYRVACGKAKQALTSRL